MRREDVLVYTTGALNQDTEVTGPFASCYVSTTAPDTDFTAKLVDVFPDGHARNLCDGIFRLRYRDGLNTSPPRGPEADLSGHDSCGRDQQCLSCRTPHAARHLEQQLPALRPQPEYRPCSCR